MTLLRHIGHTRLGGPEQPRRTSVLRDRRCAATGNKLLTVNIGLAVVLCGAACSPGDHGAASAAGRQLPARTRTGSFVAPEWEVREWKVERYIARGHHLEPVAFRSGGGVTALLQRSPLAMYEFMFDVPGHPAGGLADPRKAWIEGNPPFGSPSDIAGVTRDGVTLYLDGATGDIKAQTVSSRRAEVLDLGTSGSVQSACALGPNAFAYIDGSQPGEIFVRYVDSSAPARRLAFPSGLVDSNEVRWSQLRFGGSNGGACVLWAPRMRAVVVVGDTALHAIDDFIEPVKPEPWFARIWHWLSRTPPHPYALDVTSVPGAVAVLVAGSTSGAGRIVDFYADSGSYLETMVLPRRALRVAGNHQRLFVLRESLDSILFASYVLPWSLRRGMAPEQPGAIDARLPAAWRRALRGDETSSTSEAGARRSE